MLARLVAGARPEVGRQMPVTFGTIEQLASNREQRRRAAGGDQRLMKLAMGDLPVRIAQRMLWITLLDALQPVQCRNNGDFPVVIPSLNRAPDQFHFDKNAGVGDFQQVLATDRWHAKSALLLGIDQAFGGKSRQRFPQRGEARAEALSQDVEAQRLAGGKTAGDDLLTQPMRDVGGDGLAEFLAGTNGAARHGSADEWMPHHAAATTILQ